MEGAALQMAFMVAMQRFHRLKFTAAFGDLVPAEFFVLELVHRHREAHPEATGMYVSRLVAQMRHSAPAVSRTLRALQAKELIERSVDNENRRNTFIYITEKGMQTRADAQRMLHESMERVASAMGEEDMRTLLALLNRLIGIIEMESAKTNKGEPT